MAASTGNLIYRLQLRKEFIWLGPGQTILVFLTLLIYLKKQCLFLIPLLLLLRSRSDPAAPKEVLLLDVMNNLIVLKANVELKENEAQGLVSTANLSEGILRLYAFDKSNNLLAHRACYVTLESSHVPVEFKA